MVNVSQLFNLDFHDMSHVTGNDPVEEDIDIGGNEPPVSSYTPDEKEKGTSKKSDTRTTSRTSSGNLGTLLIL